MRTVRPVPLLTVPLLTVALLAASCGWGDDPDERTITVLAASSLTDVFERLAADFEEQHPDVAVELSFGSSTDLAEQAVDGAPGDVLATADETSMAIARDGGAVAGPVAFATNVLVIVTPPDDPAGVRTLADLGGAVWVRCDDAAPCGRVARAVLDTQGVDAEPASLEEDARATLDKVVSGEAEAALVYASDAASAGEDVATVEVPGAEEHLATYLVAALEQSDEPDLARAWVDLVTGDAGRDALAAAGFGTP